MKIVTDPERRLNAVQFITLVAVVEAALLVWLLS